VREGFGLVGAIYDTIGKVDQRESATGHRRSQPKNRAWP
jgi:hypothetical protein